jgi:hypothetical protein
LAGGQELVEGLLAGLLPGLPVGVVVALGREQVQDQSQILGRVGVAAEDVESAKVDQVVGLDLAKVHVLGDLLASGEQVGLELVLVLLLGRELVLTRQLGRVVMHHHVVPP